MFISGVKTSHIDGGVNNSRQGVPIPVGVSALRGYADARREERAMLRRIITTMLVAATASWQTASARSPKDSVFPYQQADEARQVARDQCKPLTLHFVPDSKLGGEQLVAFYRGPNRVSDEVLEKVVIVALPTRKFARFAKQFGITNKGGYRTISAYDLGVLDKKSRGTISSGFV